MAKVDIFSKIPDLNYKEESDYHNSDDFTKLVTSRRSCRVYTDDPVPEEIIQKCLDLALLAPNSSNLQPWQFYWVKSKDKRKLLDKYCLNQPAAATAPEIIVAVACPEMWKTTRKLMLQAFEEQDEVKTPKAAIQYYNKIVPLAYDQGPFGIKGAIKKVVLFFIGLKKPTPRGPASKSDMQSWAHKSTALACQNLMLAFRSYGYDTCPMEGLDENRVHDLLELPKSAKVCMAISVGKRAKNGIYGPRIRFDRDLFVKTV
jgi:nitroreductase